MATVNVFKEVNREGRTVGTYNGNVLRRVNGIEAHVSVDFEYGDTADALDFLTKAFEAARAELEAMLPASEEPEPLLVIDDSDLISEEEFGKIHGPIKFTGFDRVGEPWDQDEADRLVIAHVLEEFDDEMDLGLDLRYIGTDTMSWFVVEGYDVDDFKPAPEFKVGQRISAGDYPKLPVGTTFAYDRDEESLDWVWTVTERGPVIPKGFRFDPAPRFILSLPQ